jgi:hypothetical protein
MRVIRLTSLLVGFLALASQSSAQQQCVLGTNFTRPAWKAQDDMFNNYKSVSGPNPWNHQFLSDCAIYRCVRSMDADETNRSMREHWMDRPQKNNPVQSPIAYEWFIDICNHLNADLWVCIPHRTASRSSGNNPNDYALRLAILVKTGVDVKDIDLGDLSTLSSKSAQDFIDMGGVRTTAALKENLKLYIEYSNETWNPQFNRDNGKEGQYTWCFEEGTALNLGYLPGSRFHAWAAIRIFRAMDLVFGTQSVRIIKILAGQIGANSELKAQTEVVNNLTYNPWQSVHNAMAIAPYIGHKATTLEALRADIPAVATQVSTTGDLARKLGIKLLAYEAGQHITTNQIAINSHSDMYDIYIDYLNMLKEDFDLVMHFSQVGVWGESGAWGAKRFTGQSLADAHKYRALVDWVKDNPIAQSRTPFVNSLHPSSTQSQPRHIYLLNGTRLDAPTQSSEVTQLQILQGADGTVWTQTLSPFMRSR